MSERETQADGGTESVTCVQPNIVDTAHIYSDAAEIQDNNTKN